MLVIRSEIHRILSIRDKNRPDRWVKVTYSQPLYNYLIASLYSIWERLTWRIWRFLERFQKNLPMELEDFDEDKPLELQIPFTNRQDLRCAWLHEKGRIILSEMDVPNDRTEH